MPDLFDPPPAEPVDESPSTSDSRDPAAAFFGRLQHLTREALAGQGDARARLARLRRCLHRRGVAPESFREIGNALPSGSALAALANEAGVSTDRALDDSLLVATLYALHAAKSDEPWYGGYVTTESTLGASCRAAGDGSGSMDQRFSALLDARRADLPYRLRQTVALCAAKGVGIRYDGLLRDLLRWDDPQRSVQRAWAQAYWAPFTTS